MDMFDGVAPQQLINIFSTKHVCFQKCSDIFHYWNYSGFCLFRCSPVNMCIREITSTRQSTYHLPGMLS